MHVQWQFWAMHSRDFVVWRRLDYAVCGELYSDILSISKSRFRTRALGSHYFLPDDAVGLDTSARSR